MTGPFGAARCDKVADWAENTWEPLGEIDTEDQRASSVAVCWRLMDRESPWMKMSHNISIGNGIIINI